MAIILYEGFNYSDSDVVKIDPNYWTTNNSSSISYTSGRTNSQIVIANHAAGSLNYNTLTLSNFSDPLLTNNGFAFGFSVTVLSSAISGTSPFRIPYIEFKDDSNNTVLKFNLITTTYSGVTSLGLEVEQGGAVVTVYDFSSYVGRSWTVFTNPVINERVYLEFFIDAKDQNKMSIRVSEDGGTIHGYLLNSNNTQETSISGFSSLGSVTWFSKNTNTSGNTTLDDLYFSKGDTEEECYLGSSTRIHRLTLSANGSKTEWTTNNVNSQYLNLNNNDGDANYAYASLSQSGLVSTYAMSNLPSVPSGDLSIIVKPINIVRKTSTTNNAKFINVMNNNGGAEVDLGSEYTVTSTNYSHTNSDYIITNPITGNPWTVNDIDNMQIGIKNLGVAS